MRVLTLPLVQKVSEGTDWSLRSIGCLAPREEPRLQALETRISQLALNQSRLQALEEENKTLREQARVRETLGYEGIGAQVLSRDRAGGRFHLLIDRGSEDRLEVGQAVLSGEGMYIGKIFAVSERVSTVEVFTDPDARTAGMLSTGNRLLGVIAGKENGTATLTYIPPSEKISRDDVIVTAGTEDRVPGRLPIAIVNNVSGTPQDAFLEASVEPLASLDRLNSLLVLRVRVTP